jgi:hypothetical protein
MPASLSDTAAFKIIRQMMDHAWGSDEELEDGDLVFILDGFRSAGGSWQGVLSGSTVDLQKLDDVIESYVQARALAIIATRISSNKGSVVS